jgi:hypothetical protein
MIKSAMDARACPLLESQVRTDLKPFCTGLIR